MKSDVSTSFLGNTSRQIAHKNFEISIVNYRKKVSEDWHLHEKTHISAIMQGGNLESRKSKDVQAQPGTVLFYEQGELHRNRFTKHPSSNLNIEFNSEFFDQDINLSNFSSEPENILAMYRVYFEIMLNDQNGLNEIEQILRTLFWNESIDLSGHWIENLKTVLHDRWYETPSLDELSKELGIHPVTISKSFPKYSGMTLATYMRKLKVNRAINHLINSSHSIAETASFCGFSDQSHMTRIMKNYTGLTPHQVRSLR